MNIDKIYNKYPKTVSFESGEKLIHFSDLKLFIKDLINNGYTLWCYDGMFYSPGEYVSSPVNLVRSFPEIKEGDCIDKIIDENLDLLYSIAQQDSIEDGTDIEKFYVSITLK